MGFFSWLTSDTHESISNSFSSRGALPVYLVTPDNEHIFEPEYEGYGVFGGFDAYALLAKWNAPELCTGDTDHDRGIGIQLAFGSKPLKFPLKFSTNETVRYEQLPPAEYCPDQGYFYCDTEEDDEEDSW